MCTNNEGEWESLEMGFRAAKKYGATSISARGDSQLVVRQVSGEYEVKAENLRASFLNVVALVSHFSSTTFAHVPRGQNTAADALANRAADGITAEIWLSPPPPPPQDLQQGRNSTEVPTRVTPDLATVLLGVLPSAKSAHDLGFNDDWFNIVRFSTLRHIKGARDKAWQKNIMVPAADIIDRVIADVKRELLLRWSRGKSQTIRTWTLLKGGVEPADATAQDFKDLRYIKRGSRSAAARTSRGGGKPSGRLREQRPPAASAEA